jgi:hypothetical protein
MGLVPIEGKPNHWFNEETGRPIVARPGMTEEEILAELNQPENLPPVEAPRDLQAELDALKAVLIKEDPTRADKIEEETAILEVALPTEK